MPLHKRVETWVERLSSETAPAVPAAELYQGEHWSVAQSMPEQAVVLGRRVQLWVASAGYGLIPSTAPLHPYAATFTSSEPDAVTEADDREAWWTELSSWPGPVPGTARSLEQLAKMNPDDEFVVAMSPPYVAACRRDLIRARNALISKDTFSLVCVGSRTDAALASSLIACDARLQHEFGGSRQSLNARVARHLVATVPGRLTRSESSQQLRSLLAKQPPIPRYDRRPCTDSDVAAFIEARLRCDTSLSRSRLLRELRDAGRACEQRRFANIFDQVRSRDVA